MSTLQSKEGGRVPEVTFRTRQGGQWKDVHTHELFDGKNVVVFSLPGAYTPTCSSRHLPRYNELVPTFRSHGIDEVVCIAVNDAFVMSEWAQAQQADRITMVPDGNGEFTQAMGMLVDRRELGFGMRSWRYAMVVRDGWIEKMFIEPQREGDPLEVSDADTLLRYLAPGEKVPESVAVFTQPGCPYCASAKAMLREAGLGFEEITLGHGITACTLQAVAGASTTPQVFIGGQKIGGADALRDWLLAAGKKPSQPPP